MEDAATAEIARAQLWQWVRHGVTLADGRRLDSALYAKLRDQAVQALPAPVTPKAAELLDGLVLDRDFAEFLTLPAYAALTP
jgi:malate synthase